MSDLNRQGDLDLTLGQVLANSGKMFVVNYAITFSSTAYKDVMLVRNPSGSGVSMRIMGVKAHLELAALTSQLNEIAMRVSLNPTVTADGNLRTNVNTNSGSSNTGDGEIYKNPTTSSSGSAINENRVVNSSINLDVNGDFILAEGDELLVELAVNDSANNGEITIIWGEM